MVVDAGSSTSNEISSLDHFVAGLGAGCTSTLLLHPVDFLKVRIQVDTKQQTYRNLASAVFDKYGLKGFYRGVTTNVMGNGVAWGFYMCSFNFLDNLIRHHLNVPLPPAPLSTPTNLCLAFMAGATTVYVSNPFWVLKVRMCQTDITNQQYATLKNSVKTIYSNEGIFGFYKGSIPGLMATTHGCLLLAMYNKLKYMIMLRKSTRFNEDITKIKLCWYEVLMASSLSKASATLITYPLQIIRTRLQNNGNNYYGFIDVLKKTILGESIFGLYKGLIASLIRVTPSACITFLTYEALVNTIKRLHSIA